MAANRCIKCSEKRWGFVKLAKAELFQYYLGVCFVLSLDMNVCSISWNDQVLWIDGRYLFRIYNE